MASFTEPNFLKKLEELNSSQQSIQTLSLWLIHHRKHSKPIVDLWLQELSKVETGKKLTFLYLANDVVQNSRKKTPAFVDDFKDVLPDAYEQAASDASDKMKKSMRRLIDIWGERGVFDKAFIKIMKGVLGKRGGSGRRHRSKHAGQREKSSGEPSAKKKKLPSVPMSLIAEVEKMNEDETDTPAKPPEAEVLVSQLQELEQSASSDAVVREKISALPPEVSDTSMLNKIKDTKEANGLYTRVDDACTLLADYNSRLAGELEDRRRTGKMMKDYVTGRKNALAKAEERLKEFKDKLSKVTTVRQELKSHIENLPDLSKLPDISAGLAPLPSAGDLFSL